MSVVIETTLGDLTVDLYLSERPRACQNFLKLCKIKYYNYNLFHTISRGFIAQTGDPTGSRSGGESIYGVLDGTEKRYFEAENKPRIKHTRMGLISFVGNEERMIGSQFFITLGDDLTYLDEKHCVFGEVVEGTDILDVINEAICDTDDRPYQDVRITHTVILDDPFPDPAKLKMPSRSPSPSVERLQGGRIAPDEEIDEMEGKTNKEIAEMQAEREAKARATILEMVGDIPDAEMAPPENVLFVCKLNPVTTDEDLEIIFNRFGKIKSCEVIRDKKTGDSLQYAFIEFEEEKSCEDAYFKMDNILIDDRRIHVDFSQSVSKIKWHGKGKGVTHYDEKGRSTIDGDDDIGKGHYKLVHSNEKSKSSKKSGHNSSPKMNLRQSYNVRSPSRSPVVERRRNRTPSKTDRSDSRNRHGDSYSRRERSRTPSKSGRYEGNTYDKKTEASGSPRKKHYYERRSRSHSPKRDQYRLSSRKGKQYEAPEKNRSHSRNKSPRNYKDYVPEYSSFRNSKKSSGSRRDNSDQNDKNRSYSHSSSHSSKRDKSRSPSYNIKHKKSETKSKGVSSREEGEKHVREQAIHDNKEYKKHRSNLKDPEKNTTNEFDSEAEKKIQDKKTKTTKGRKNKKRSKHRDSSDNEDEKKSSADGKPKKKKKYNYSSSESSSESSPEDNGQRKKNKRNKSISESSSKSSEDRKENYPRMNEKAAKERTRNKLKNNDGDRKFQTKNKKNRSKKETSSSSSSSSSSSTTSSSSPSSSSSSDSDGSVVMKSKKIKKKQK